MSTSTTNRQCPVCEQLISMDVRYVKTRSGVFYHEGCAKEIAEAYFKLTMKTPKKNKEARTPVLKDEQERNDS
jgi:hypothetical protein